MEQEPEVAAFVAELGGKCRGTRIFVANNSLAALKFVMSLKDFSFRRFGRCVFEFYGLERPSDRAGDSKYLELLTDYQEVLEDDTAASFKNVSLLCAAAVKFRCQYVWPGWGHASEDPAFPAACQQHGLVFLGPSASAMARLGGKISANQLADSCGIETIPWLELSEDALISGQQFAQEVGYPIMVKTPEGGGGKGIRVVDAEADLAQQIETVKQETNCRQVFLTKYLTEIKHIELQIVADSAGEVEIVSSRDCTLQRRNQKLVEEGPALIPPAVLAEISERAKQLVRAAEYTNAGTIEFVYVTASEQAYFLEANPRLQVEHTVTELLTETNLCAVQWLLSCGASLAALRRQQLLREIVPGRHVVAARVIAECADSGFLPSTGSIAVSGSFPVGSVGYFAVDRGQIGPENDSQFGHVFGTGASREEAVRTLQMVLSSIKIHGNVKTLNRFLFDLISTPEFAGNTHSTRFSESFRQQWCATQLGSPFYFLAFVAMHAHRSGLSAAPLVLQHHGVEIAVRVTRIDAAAYAVETNGGLSVLKLALVHPDRYRVKTAERQAKNFFLSQNGNAYDVFCNGKTRRFRLGAAGNEVVSEVAGRIVRFLKDGHVRQHEEYLEIESMKNIMRFAAPREGTLTKKVAPGDAVRAGQVLAEISADTPESVVRYTEKTEYRNTQHNFTLNLFRGYAVPEKLQRYDTRTLFEALALYAAQPPANDTPAAAAYLLRAFPVLARRKPDLRQHGELIRALKAKAGRASRPDLLEHVLSLENAREQQQRLEERTRVEEQLRRGDQGLLTAESALSLRDAVVLSLCLVPAVQRDACLLWVRKVFGKHGVPEPFGVRFRFGSSGCLVTAEGLASPDQLAHEEGLVFYVKHEETPPLTSAHMATNISVSAELALGWQTFQNGELAPLYDGIDPILAERLHLEAIPRPELAGIFWHRRLFVYTSESAIYLQCVLAPLNGTVDRGSFQELLGELRAAYLLQRTALPFAVSVCVTNAVDMSVPAFSDHIMSDLAPAISLIEDCPAAEIILRGAISSAQTPLPKEHQISSPCPEDLPFVVSIYVHRGFQEITLCVNQDQVFYAIDRCLLQNTNGDRARTNIGLLKQASLAQTAANRAKAKALGTIYIYDLMALIEIFFKEQSAEIEIAEIVSDTVPCAMKGWRVTQPGLDFILVGNDITQNSGAFSVDEDQLFSKCADLALAAGLPFIYISSNSGAKIQVLERLKDHICYDAPTDTVYLTQDVYDALPDKDQISVSPELVNEHPVQKITAIFGEFGLGVENLSYSAEIARRMALLYRAVPTLTYVTGRAVGIGAYLARLGGRVIQKDSAPIILTGYQALNRLLQQELYHSNLELGGPEIMARNGVVQTVVSTDLEGVREILKWLEYLAARQLPALATPAPAATPSTPAVYPAQLELLNSEELVEYLADKDSCTEYFAEWAPNVRVARIKLNGAPCGVIFPRVGSVPTTRPTPAGDAPVLWTEYVLLPETSRKIAQAIRDFSLEGLNVLILANWRGFSAGHLDMYNGVLQDGSEIVNSMVFAQTQIFTYIGPQAELRGGSWVVFDQKIGSNIFFAVHPTGSGSVIHPDGLSRIKCKPAELQAILTRSGADDSKTNQFRLGKTFCALHDTAERMLKMQAIDKIVSVAELKTEITRHFQNKTSH